MVKLLSGWVGMWGEWVSLASNLCHVGRMHVKELIKNNFRGWVGLLVILCQWRLAAPQVKNTS